MSHLLFGGGGDAADLNAAALIHENWRYAHVLNIPMPDDLDPNDSSSVLGYAIRYYHPFTVQALIDLIPAIELEKPTAHITDDECLTPLQLSKQLHEETEMHYGLVAATACLPVIPTATWRALTNPDVEMKLLACLKQVVFAYLFGRSDPDPACASAPAAVAVATARTLP